MEQFFKINNESKQSFLNSRFNRWVASRSTVVKEADLGLVHPTEELFTLLESILGIK
jgi:hypothetical protein